MFSQSQIKTLELLDKYFSETPDDIIKTDIKAINDLGFVGTSANSYFTMFHKHFNYEPFKVNLAKYRIKNATKSISPIEQSNKRQLEAMS